MSAKKRRHHVVPHWYLRGLVIEQMGACRRVV